jgi:arylsulfatase
MPMQLVCVAAVAIVVAACSAPGRGGTPTSQPPNVLLIITNDLGVGELGCYGQRTIRTPHIDALAREGVLFTNAYAGSCVCAPSRCTLLTGLHTGHAAIRDNKEIRPTGQQPLPAESVTLATLLGGRGYATGAVGKWGLGPPGSSGDPARHGFDLFFGSLCQRHAHNHCPSHLYRNGEVVALPGNQDTWPDGVVVGGAYAPDLFREEAVGFIRENAMRPFFLLYATPVPHAALQVPEDSLAEYRVLEGDAAYEGTKRYLKHPTPRARRW